MTDKSHTHWMLAAAELAHNVRMLTSPRPWVGCVIVATDGTTHQGATDGKTGPHAEQVALQSAGDKAAGATLYSTLEPCAHQGQTPPCTQAIIDAGIARVVVAITDPDPRVSGQGLKQLTDAGLDVHTGVCADEITRQLRAYICHRSHKRPYVTLKLAATLDGKVALADGTSQWLTGPKARADAHLLRAESDAVLVGANTARLDDPQLTVRQAKLPPGVQPQDVQPRRFVLGEIPDGSNLSRSDPDAGVSPATPLSGDVGEILAELAGQGIVSLLVEGGPVTAAAFHEAGLVDRYVFYFCPALAGGDQARGMLAGEARGMLAGQAAGEMAELWRGEIADVALLGPDLRIEILPKSPNPS